MIRDIKAKIERFCKDHPDFARKSVNSVEEDNIGAAILVGSTSSCTLNNSVIIDSDTNVLVVNDAMVHRIVDSCEATSNDRVYSGYGILQRTAVVNINHDYLNPLHLYQVCGNERCPWVDLTVRHSGYWVLETVPKPVENSSCTAKSFSTPRKSLTTSPSRWHKIIGHPGIKAIESLLNNVGGQASIRKEAAKILDKYSARWLSFAVDTPAQNGAAEISGKVIVETARTLRIALDYRTLYELLTVDNTVEFRQDHNQSRVGNEDLSLKADDDLGTLKNQNLAGAIVEVIKIHRDPILPPPKTWRELKKHTYHIEFLSAPHLEFNHLKADTFEAVYDYEGHMVPLKWVWTYKFDSESYLTKFKERLSVRGDLQLPTLQETYVAKLAIKTFRAMMALMSAFGVETRQFDLVNMFCNVCLKLTDHLLSYLYGSKDLALLFY
ncbi:hypothetical protein HI914_00119 [Erysiphe necator]|nr:hypothetical protein HI914_00119 [Erysiphe necator]